MKSAPSDPLFTAENLNHVRRETDSSQITLIFKGGHQ